MKLLPITQTANRNMTKVENLIHDLVFTRNKVLWIKVTADYPKSPKINPVILYQLSISFQRRLHTS